ncbi:hypothetical protein NPIL_106151 [Nephila pilipes]|uniref:Uncharacterized protein n=1 Tax=Nephila pilipes TaxID=299642 RepID=A0A8X6QVD4_NEPPI|nr:hypothetical protein NPIL_106151 [Nephila pilipes]
MDRLLNCPSTFSLKPGGENRTKMHCFGFLISNEGFHQPLPDPWSNASSCRNAAGRTVDEGARRASIVSESKERRTKRLEPLVFYTVPTGWGHVKRCSRVINGWMEEGACSCACVAANDDIRCVQYDTILLLFPWLTRRG